MKNNIHNHTHNYFYNFLHEKKNINQAVNLSAMNAKTIQIIAISVWGHIEPCLSAIATWVTYRVVTHLSQQTAKLLFAQTLAARCVHRRRHALHVSAL